MRGNVVTSAVLHCLVLACALLTIGAPPSLETPESEAMPVDLVSADQLQQGEKTAPKKDHAAKKQTVKQTEVANAQNAGENSIDLKNPATPTARPTDDNVAAGQKKVETPTPKNDPTPNDVKTIEQTETEAAPKEVAAIPQVKPEITPPTPTPPKPDPTPTPPLPTPEVKAETPPPPPTPQPAEITVPDNIPVPVVKPEPIPQKTAEKTPDVKPEVKPDPVKPDPKVTDKTTTQSTTKSADDGKKADDKKRETAKSSNAQSSDFNVDQISTMLNKQSSAGGAKRSKQEASAGADTQVASLGGKKSAGGGKLSASELDGLKSLIQGNWNVVAGLDGASEVRVKVVIQLDKSGNVIGSPTVTATGGPEGTQNAISSSALRAVMRSAPFKDLPAEKFDGENGWNQVVLNFDASDLGL
ncbi:hypothetical protein [Rhizobium tubonense]|uniref:Uncharacterized protein n=1 Tax=Rhizobium tubonense TaxID=484088 RepID=A0A2W4E520_9HYPH|nr:hypothetical protein [Rhizobium tubonense]PZM07623.1 hypothetical protein CPY51_31355 [Rhizobium tubonense]